FTLHHELGHLATRTSSICSEQTLGSRVAEEDGGVERWCERFAAALLMPEDAVRSQLRELAARSPVTDLDTVARLARKFGVSLRAATLRLIGLQLASWELYRQVPDSADSKAAAGGGSGRSRPKVRLDEYGSRTAKIFLRGLRRDAVDASEVMRYLDISYRNIDELERMLS
ncbi:MAG: ImmA/IrrE family metallo-endopeptidase, partial [Candidatus Eisenbacteria bacterium]|nr:ImmA/IrrE family metallo-endopeptidase [Candidatus Eisenbacteria bacterium]